MNSRAVAGVGDPSRAVVAEDDGAGRSARGSASHIVPAPTWEEPLCSDIRGAGVREDDGSLRWVGSDKTLDREPAISGWRRFQAWLLGLFPIENQL